MDHSDSEKRPPEGTLIYREYEALLPDDTRAPVAVTLSERQLHVSPSSRSRSARP